MQREAPRCGCRHSEAGREPDNSAKAPAEAGTQAALTTTLQIMIPHGHMDCCHGKAKAKSIYFQLGSELGEEQKIPNIPHEQDFYAWF